MIMPKSLPLVTVVIVNWNGKNVIMPCLEALRNQTFKSFRTVLVDNGSQDGSVEYVREHFPEVHVISLPENHGFSAANNMALRSVDTKYAALLNNDAVSDPDWLATLVHALEKTPEAGFAASKILCFHCPDYLDRAGDAYTIAGAGALRGRGRLSREFEREEYIFGACAAAAIYRMEMLREVGFFDESFFLLYEDVDLSFRAQLMGYRCIFVPESKVLHMVSHSIGRDSYKSVYYGHRNLEWVYIKNMPSRLILKTFFFHLVYVLVSLLFFTVTGKLRPFVRAKVDALKNMPKILEKRKSIQKNKRADDAYLWRLLDQERFFLRWFSRKSIRH